MSQTEITSFFNSRKRPATEDIINSKSKKIHIERLPKKCQITDCDKDRNAGTLHQVALSTEVVHEKPKLSVSSNISEDVKEDNIPCQNEPFSKKTHKGNVPSSKEELLKLARKDLSLGDIKKKLAGSSRLAELRASAERISKGIGQLKQESDKRHLRQFKSIDVDVPVSPSKKTQIQKELVGARNEEKVEITKDLRLLISPRKVVVSPVKSPSKVPAYIRHAALATSSNSLPLPYHYRVLGEVFRALETVVSLLYNRSEAATFAKLKPSIQEMLKRNFTEKHLAQIKHLVPDFYNFEVQKVKNFSASSHKEEFEMIVTPNFPNDIKVMNPTVLLERRRYFYDTLLSLVKKCHSQYLSSLDPPMDIPDHKLTRWHPEFQLEKVPEVDAAKLPLVPNTETYSSAQDVLSKARELFKCNTKMERALEKLAQAKSRGFTEREKQVIGNLGKETPGVSTQTPKPSTSNVTILNPALRNLPAALLEKVKAKQAAKALEAMTRTSEQDAKYNVYCRLPDLARTLRNIFVTERKNVLALSIVLSKLDSSFKANVSNSSLQSDIKALAEEAPEFLKLQDVRNTSYVKLDRNLDLNKVVSKLNALASKLKIN